MIRKKCFNDLADLNSISKSYALSEEVGWIFGARFNYWFDSNIYHQFGAYNIEVRHPFFDTRLVEFMLQLPPECKYKDGVIKRILRDSMVDILPELVRTRKDKAEFSESVRYQLPKYFFQEKISYNILKSGFVSNEDIDNIYPSAPINHTLYISFVTPILTINSISEM